MSEYTPTTAEELQEAFEYWADGCGGSDGGEVKRFLAEHDAALVEKLADAIEIGLGRGFTGADDHNATAAAEGWLRARAAEIREGWSNE